MITFQNPSDPPNQWRNLISCLKELQLAPEEIKQFCAATFLADRADFYYRYPHAQQSLRISNKQLAYYSLYSPEKDHCLFISREGFEQLRTYLNEERNAPGALSRLERLKKLCQVGELPEPIRLNMLLRNYGFIDDAIGPITKRIMDAVYTGKPFNDILLDPSDFATTAETTWIARDSRSRLEEYLSAHIGMLVDQTEEIVSPGSSSTIRVGRPGSKGKS